MVRAKKVVVSPAQAETAAMLEKLKEEFAADIKELDEAKRRFSTRFVDEIISAIGAKVPAHVMAMPVREFARTLQESERTCDEDEPIGPQIEKTPTAHPKGPTTYKSLKTPSGARVKIPSMITPRVDGAGMVRSRLSRRGEVLISLNGTPVLAENADSAAKQGALINNEQTAMIQQLLQREESELTPETRAIVGNLRAVLTKKLPPIEGGSGRDDEGDEV